MRPFPPLLLGLCCVLLAPLWAQAETRYVTDQIEVPLRTGESTRYKILKMMPSGTPVELLGVNSTTNYARVRAADGQVGFVPEEQLQTDASARNRVAALEARLVTLQQEPGSLAAQLARTQSEQTVLRSQYQALEREKQLLEQQLAIIRHASANVLDITNDRERLRLQVADLTRSRADLEQENRDIKNQSSLRWFLIGAGVLVGGIVLGLVLPHLQLGRRRKGAWGDI